jgi:hypothetical protein
VNDPGTGSRGREPEAGNREPGTANRKPQPKPKTATETENREPKPKTETETENRNRKPQPVTAARAIGTGIVHRAGAGTQERILGSGFSEAGEIVAL